MNNKRFLKTPMLISRYFCCIIFSFSLDVLIINSPRFLANIVITMIGDRGWRLVSTVLFNSLRSEFSIPLHYLSHGFLPQQHPFEYRFQWFSFFFTYITDPIISIISSNLWYLLCLLPLFALNNVPRIFLCVRTPYLVCIKIY